jgi:spermidine synthase
MIIIFFIFLLSGISGLIYEVVWARMLTIILGSSVFAVSTVLTSFMAGLAIGSLYFGRVADKVKNPLSVYGWLEIGTGIYALLTPLLFAKLSGIYVLIHNHVHGSLHTLILIRFLLCFLALLAPTVLMGGTLPAISKFVVRRLERLGTNVGGLYGINTLGATIGCIAAGFLLIEFIGMKATIYLAFFINLAVGGTTFLLGKSWAALKGEDEDRQVSSPRVITDHRETPDFIIYIVLVTYAFSGFTALAYEVAWTRVLSMIFFTTTYAFTTMLATILCGIALGSFLFRRFIDRLRRPLLLFGILEIAIGLWAIFTLPIFPIFSSVVGQTMVTTLGPFWWKHLGVKLAVPSLIMIIPTVLMGALFPLVNKMCMLNTRNIGKGIGGVYSLNTAGSIFGSFAAGFIMIPFLGLQKTIMCIALIDVMIGIVASWFHKFRTQKTRWGILGVLLLFVGGSFLFAPRDMVRQVCVSQLRSPWELLYCGEGIDGTTMILQNGDISLRRLMVNLHQYVGDNSRVMMRVQKWQAHLPLLLHFSPKRVLMIGLGTGITAGAAAMHNVKLTACEISPGVLKAMTYFSQENNDVSNNPQY